MTPNFLIFLAAGLVPMVVGSIWYNPKVLGTAWMKAAEVSEEKMKGANMAVLFGLAYLFSVLVALSLYSITVHQSHLYSILVGEPGFGEEGSDIMKMLTGFMEQYGQNYRTFKHGAFHGVLAGILFALPILGTNALFERKGWKYILINAGYWIVCLALTGGVVCAFA